jgi:hypothetical protein
MKLPPFLQVTSFSGVVWILARTHQPPMVWFFTLSLLLVWLVYDRATSLLHHRRELGLRPKIQRQSQLAAEKMMARNGPSDAKVHLDGRISIKARTQGQSRIRRRRDPRPSSPGPDMPAVSNIAEHRARRRGSNPRRPPAAN